MKKVIGMLSLFFVLTMIGCSKEPAKTDVVVVPAPVEKTNTIVIEKEVPDNSTTIVLDKNGVKVEAKKVDVKIEK